MTRAPFAEVVGPSSEANQAIIAEFELGRVPGEFHHADHVRVAFAYVAELPLLEALARFPEALRRFALSKGKPQLLPPDHYVGLFALDPRTPVANCSGAIRLCRIIGRILGAQLRLAGMEGRHPGALLHPSCA